MVIRKVELETVCGITSRIPDNQLPEVAFAGKSNVGKSSLINALMNRRSLARISSRPGKTQTINFYNINDAMYLVDLPGYGYAAAAQEIKAKWGRMIENYLHKSKQLAAIFLLIDVRHDPSDNDRMMYDWMLRQGYTPIIVATKVDKLRKSQVAKHLQAVRDGLNMDEQALLIPFSSVTKEGRETLWRLMDRLTEVEELVEGEGGSGMQGISGMQDGSGLQRGLKLQGESGGQEYSGTGTETEPERGNSSIPGSVDGNSTGTENGGNLGNGSGSNPGIGTGGSPRNVSGSNPETGNGGEQEAPGVRKKRWKAEGKPVPRKTRRNRERNAGRKRH